MDDPGEGDPLDFRRAVAAVRAIGSWAVWLVFWVAYGIAAIFAAVVLILVLLNFLSGGGVLRN